MRRLRGALLFLLLPAATAWVPAPGRRPALPDTIAGTAYSVSRGVRTEIRFAHADSLLAMRIQGILEAEAPLPGLPASVPGAVRVVVAHSTEAFDSITGGTVPEWRAAVSIPADSLMVLPNHEGQTFLGPEGRRILRHEWAHLGLHEYLGSLRVPRWFDEGYAQWASGGWDASEAWRLRILIAAGRAPPLDSLSLDWPRDAASAGAAYLLAASAVAYLLRESGSRGLALFLGRWREGRSFESALRRTFGRTSGQFEEDWRRDVRRRYGWLFVLSHSAVFWMLMALVLLGMMRMRRRYNRERLARLRAAELPDRPAWWDDEADPTGPEDPRTGVDGPGESHE